MAYATTASNTTTGKCKEGYHLNRPQDFEAPKDALTKTEYAKYQDKVQNRNNSITNKNIAKLKQD